MKARHDDDDWVDRTTRIGFENDANKCYTHKKTVRSFVILLI